MPMHPGLSRSAETFFKAMAPLKNSAAMADHPSHPSHSHSSYETWLLNPDYHQPPIHNLMVRQSSLSSGKGRWTMTAQQELSSNTEICPSKISEYPPLNCYSTADYVTLYHPNPTLYKPHADWIAAAKNREIILSRRNARLIEQYNKTTHTLCPLQKGQIVTIQRPTPLRWDTTGQVVETLPNHQYHVRVDGSGRITLRNRRFLRKLETPTTPPLIPSAAPETSTPNPNPMPLKPNTPVLQTMGTGITSNTTQPSTMTQTKTPQALSRLLPHNQPGLKELIPPQRPLTSRNGGDVEGQ